MHAKRARSDSGGGNDEEGKVVPAADGFEAPLFGARTVGQVTTLPYDLRGGASDRAGAWYVAAKDSLLHVSAAGRVRSVATCEGDGSLFRGVALSPDGALFVADLNNHKIRRVEVATGAVTTVACSGTEGGSDGVGEAAEFHNPVGITISPDGSALFVADHDNNKIRRVEVATGAVTTLAGSGAQGSADGVGGAAEFSGPCGVAISPDGGALFVADPNNHKIRRVEVATGAVTTVASSGTEGGSDGVGGAAQFQYPLDVAISADGSTVLVRTNDSALWQVCVAAPPPPPSFAPLVVPPSTFFADMKKTRGDATLPTGLVTFVVGKEEQRLEHVSKNLFCVRSEY